MVSEEPMLLPLQLLAFDPGWELAELAGDGIGERGEGMPVLLQEKETPLWTFIYLQSLATRLSYARSYVASCRPAIWSAENCHAFRYVTCNCPSSARPKSLKLFTTLRTPHDKRKRGTRQQKGPHIYLPKIYTYLWKPSLDYLSVFS